MKVSLIISTYNWTSALKLALLSVAKQQLLPDELIIADDGSREETKLFINEMRKVIPVQLIHVWQKDNGYQRTIILNEAVRASSGEYIVQVDGDIILHPSFLKDHIKVAQKGFFVKGSRCLLNKETTLEALSKNRIRFNVFSPGISNRLNALCIPFVSPLLYYGSQDSISGIIGCNMAFWKTDFIKVNGYNNDIVGWGREDSEIAARLINNGVKKKKAKLLAVCYHLYHEFLSRDKDAKNIVMLNHTVSENLRWCSNGYSTENDCSIFR